MKIKISILLLSVVAIQSGCVSSFQTTRFYQPGQPEEIVNVEPISRIVIDSANVIEGTAQSVKLFKVISLSGPSNFIDNGFGSANLKSAAAFNALFQTDYNMIALPRYTTVVNKNIFITKTTVKVIGWGAKELPLNVH